MLKAVAEWSRSCCEQEKLILAKERTALEGHWCEIVQPPLLVVKRHWGRPDGLISGTAAAKLVTAAALGAVRELTTATILGRKNTYERRWSLSQKQQTALHYAAQH
jgi:hypothetical protein